MQFLCFVQIGEKEVLVAGCCFSWGRLLPIGLLWNHNFFWGLGSQFRFYGGYGFGRAEEKYAIASVSRPKSHIFV